MFSSRAVFGTQIAFFRGRLLCDEVAVGSDSWKTSYANSIDKDSTGALVAAARRGNAQAVEELFSSQEKVLAVAATDNDNRGMPKTWRRRVFTRPSFISNLSKKVAVLYLADTHRNE